MTQRKGLRRKYPATFSEWVCGISVEDALGPRTPAQPQPQRKVVRVEITTDDETEEDSLKVTYPRTSRASTRQESDIVVKKVRFEDTPKKSALKKATTNATESDSDLSSKDGAADSESSETAPEKTSNTKKNGQDESTSEAGSDTEGSAKCAKCAQRRKKVGVSTKDGEKQCASDSEGSQSSTDSAPKGKKHGKQAKSNKDAATAAKERNDASEADDEASDSSKTTADEADAPAKTSNAKNKQQGNKKGSGKQPQGSGDKGQKAQKKQESQHDKAQASNATKTMPTKKQKSSEKKAEAGKHRHDNKKGDYPEAYLAPHPRRPHLIEPIRAEVVQTEKVVEGPEDPPPNAYYDAEHGVLRVYHGPVYGNHYSQPLYPRRDASARPLPVGMPHPLHNPYYYGFNQVPPREGNGNEPVTQGMPMPAWGAVYPPHGYMTGYQAGPFGPWQPDINAHNTNAANNAPADANVTGTRGVFSLVEDKSGTMSSNFKDKDGQNNVTPGSIKVRTLPWGYCITSTNRIRTSRVTTTLIFPSETGQHSASTAVESHPMPAMPVGRLTPRQPSRAMMEQTTPAPASLLRAHGTTMHRARNRASGARTRTRIKAGTHSRPTARATTEAGEAPPTAGMGRRMGTTAGATVAKTCPRRKAAGTTRATRPTTPAAGTVTPRREMLPRSQLPSGETRERQTTPHRAWSTTTMSCPDPGTLRRLRQLGVTRAWPQARMARLTHLAGRSLTFYLSRSRESSAGQVVAKAWGTMVAGFGVWGLADLGHCSAGNFGEMAHCINTEHVALVCR